MGRIAGASITDFYYGPDHELYKEVSGSKTTYKLAGGMYEVIVDGATTTTQKSYVDGVILNNRVLISGTPSANDTLYLHTDHLGSVEATTNALGQFVNRMSFSTWGERQKSDWKPGNPTESFATSNGYTGHDQLDAHNLIHMGGRVYDPNLGRFLSADLFVQSPYDSQSFNRYSYTFNNPLSYTDPTGYRSQGPSDQHLTDAMRDRVEHVKVIGSKREQQLARFDAAATNSSNLSMFSAMDAQALMNSIVTEATAGLLYSQAIVNQHGSGALIGLGNELRLTGELRDEYARRAGMLDRSDKVGRDALKKEFRAKQTALGTAITKNLLAARTKAGHVSTDSNATKTNAGVNNLGGLMKHGGRVLIVGGIATEAVNIANAPPGMRGQITTQAGGRLGGGVAGALAGAQAGLAGGPWGVAGATIVGGVVGSYAGESAVNAIFGF